MDQISLGGTFTLMRVVGTIPVDPDGSALMELPAKRSFFFVAMDHDGWPVKRMHSFTSVMPGEVTSCIGCHEERYQTFGTTQRTIPTAFHRNPSRPEPIRGIPEVFDFVRDIQPILDKHCVACHNQERSEKGVVLSGDWTPQFTWSYETLSHRNMFGDNRNRPMSNFQPYEIGSRASKLMRLIDEKHNDVALSDHERNMVKFWLDVGANYAGTYAANAHGQIGWHQGWAPETDVQWYRNDLEWAETKAMAEAIARRCSGCHTGARTIPHTLSHQTGRFTPSWMFNLSYPEKSRIFHGPLAKSAGGYERCAEIVFADKNDPDYQAILAGIERARQYILSGTRPNITPFFANRHYTREMIRFGVLPPDHCYQTMPICPFEVDRKYWEALWYVPISR
jgi:mono/diheme cytochrome c family protein